VHQALNTERNVGNEIHLTDPDTVTGYTTTSTP
jgi:hypothetical protein